MKVEVKLQMYVGEVRIQLFEMVAVQLYIIGDNDMHAMY